MKKATKIVLITVCAAMIAAGSVLATLAYLTSTASVKNTFSVGDVQIKLDEAPVDDYGKKTEGDRVEDGNDYTLLPGETYDKDPMVTVVADSVNSYVRMFVTVNDIAALKNAFPKADYPTYYKEDLFLLEKIVGGYDKATWKCTGFEQKDKKGIYEFRYKTTVSATTTDNELEPLFETLTIPSSVDNEHLAYLKGIEIDVAANAIQATGFADANTAWAAFDAQVK